MLICSTSQLNFCPIFTFHYGNQDLEIDVEPNVTLSLLSSDAHQGGGDERCGVNQYRIQLVTKIRSIL